MLSRAQSILELLLLDFLHGVMFEWNDLGSLDILLAC